MGALVEAEIKARKLENKDGVLTRNGQFVGKLTPDGMFIDPQGNAVNLAGAAKAAQAGAEMKAQEAAKAGFRTATVTGPDGTKSGYEQDIYGTPPALRGQGGASPAGNPNARFSYEGTVGGAQQALGAVAADQAGGMGGGVQDVPGGGRVIAGPNPMAVKQREADIEVDASGKKDLRKTQIGDSSKRYEAITAAFTGAQDMKPIVAKMRELDASGVMTGSPQEAWKAFANTANSAVPGLALDYKRLSNSQTYDAEISKMVQGIAKNFPGAQSDRELAQLLNSLPNRMKTAQSRAALYDALDAKIARLEAAYRDASARYQEGGNLIGWEPPTPAAGKVLRFDAQGNLLK